MIQFKILSSRNSFAVVTLTRFFYCFFESPSEEFIFQRGIKRHCTRKSLDKGPSFSAKPKILQRGKCKCSKCYRRNISPEDHDFFARSQRLLRWGGCQFSDERVHSHLKFYSFSLHRRIFLSTFFFSSLKNNTESSPLFEVENKNVAKHQQRSSLSFFSFFSFFFFTNQWSWIEEELFRSSCFTSFSPFRWNGENSFEKSAGNLRRLLSQNFYSLLSSRFLLSRGKEAAKIQRCHETIVWNTKVYW